MRLPSDDGARRIKAHESLRLQTYDDATGKPMQPGQKAIGTATIGWGNTSQALPVRSITVAEAETLFGADIREAVRTIEDNVPTYIVDAMPQACFDALVSFVLNTGPQAFRNPKTGARTDFWRAVVQNTDRREVARQMQRWVKGQVNGVATVLSGLVKRRGEEAALWGAGVEAEELQTGTGLMPHPIEEASPEELLATQKRALPYPPADVPTDVRKPENWGAAVGVGGVSVTAAATTMTSAGQALLLRDGPIILIGLLMILVSVGLLIYFARKRT